MNASYLKRYDAFTIVEILLGIAIFSIVALTLYNIFFTGLRLNKRSEEVGQVYREATWSINAMAKDLENMVPLDYTAAYPDWQNFVGGPSSFVLMHSTDSGINAVKYYLEEPEATHIHKIIIGQRSNKNIKIEQGTQREVRLKYFLREEIPLVDYLASGFSGAQEDVEVLSINVQEDGLGFSYAVLEEEEGAGDPSISWTDDWSEGSVPSGVRIELTLVNNDKKRTPMTFKRDVFIPTGLWGQKPQQP